MSAQLLDINREAFKHTLHPSALNWPSSISSEEGSFCSTFVFGDKDHSAEASVYIAKELAQLSEIEKHISTVMALLLTSLGSMQDELTTGHGMHNAMSCFAAEELQHADMFYRYVRLLLGRDFKLANNLMAERLAVYQGTDSFFVKLGVLVASAYVGESVMTVFEHRINRMDPESRFFVSQIVKCHGLDEARHIQFDHFVFERIIPEYSPAESKRFGELLGTQLNLNLALGGDFQSLAESMTGLEYIAGNVAHAAQKHLFEVFAKLAFAGGAARKIDDVLDTPARTALADFAGIQRIHPISAPF